MPADEFTQLGDVLLQVVDEVRVELGEGAGNLLGNIEKIMKSCFCLQKEVSGQTKYKVSVYRVFNLAGSGKKLHILFETI